MFCVPKALKPLRDGLVKDFSRAATARRVVFLMLAAILVTGNRTVANLLRLIAFVERLNPSTYHRVLSHRRWNATRLARIVIGFLLDRYAVTLRRKWRGLTCRPSRRRGNVERLRSRGWNGRKS